ncbi:H(+)/Cl(-) exchange transporter ClcA [compost metagenome]
MTTDKKIIAKTSQVNYFLSLLKWLLIACLTGSIIGSVSAFFLTSLDWVTDYRENHLWIIALLPIGGLIIGLTYYYYGSSVVKGNNQLLEELHTPQQVIPFRMAPLIVVGTLVTHLFGGSAGREGTAIQMGGAIADQFTKLFRLENNDRKILLIMGISAGFASVFGTPLAGAVFAIEVMILGRIKYMAFIPALLVAIIADYTCKFWNVSHTHYSIPFVPNLQFDTVLWCISIGIVFGLAAFVFSKTTHFFGNLFNSKISYPPLRPFVGGIVIALAVWQLGTTKYIGLGIPTILDAFNHDLPSYDFILKLLLTAFTLGAGFKGGEVTPLFFIGATLGNALFLFVPLPLALLAGLGFVAVFSGATNTPIACTIMGMELFGLDCGVYMGIACLAAYLSSGHRGIYSSQIISGPKTFIYSKVKNNIQRKHTPNPSQEGN